MVRKKVWLAIWAMLLSASGLAAQGPMPMYPPMPQYGPMPPGYYGPPMPVYGRPMPMMPYYGPTGPLPPGYPPVAPYPMQPIPPAPMAPVMPVYSGAKPGAAEPYSVQPEAAQAKPAPTSETISTPPFRAPGEEIPHDAMVIEGGPSEPYSVYEGRRYRSEIKNDCTRVWFQ